VALLCQRYKVSRSGFYAWEARERSHRSRDDAKLGALIVRIHRDSRGTYGSARVHEQLKRQGIRCSNKRVARLMRELGLRARVSGLYRRSTGVHRFFAKTANLRLESSSGSWCSHRPMRFTVSLAVSSLCSHSWCIPHCPHFLGTVIRQCLRLVCRARQRSLPLVCCAFWQCHFRDTCWRLPYCGRLWVPKQRSLSTYIKISDCWSLGSSRYS
jgi:transposase InsO family protein